ncbi:hypothetical protein [Pelagicoccus sp. SDUM812003]|uniref:hypothetical protein n=1 Tax=Pelagicoccus sp. SDUM812003 TaxID=3041267 RepID=UPI00280D042F|nr:hypothetical protein [Pelagicoccus sp. SDUM812003]MDQ8201582.1 hypothetical protein [Pelagicoccus sp. SDUM812003]
MEADKAEAILQEHVRLCSDLHELFIEEGKIMRSTGAPPDKEFLERKESFLPVLGKGLELLQRINEKPEEFPSSLGPLVGECRDKLMKLMMLDRENERLLLKSTLPPKMKEAYSKVGPGQIAKAYGRFAK